MPTNLVAPVRASATLLNATIKLVAISPMFALIDQLSGQGTGQKRFKNIGWYATGGVYEEWISVDTPSVTPPSGHTLTAIQHIPL